VVLFAVMVPLLKTFLSVLEEQRRRVRRVVLCPVWRCWFRTRTFF